MTAMYVLDVPEFSALVRQLESAADVAVTKRGDYFVAETPGEIVLHRKAAGVGQAVWFGALTGGISGRIVEFSDDVLRVAPV